MKNIGILFGGNSTEYDVSLESAHGVITHMDLKKYTPVLIGITRQGQWMYYNGDLQKIADNTWHEDASCRKAVIPPDAGEHSLWIFEGSHIKKVHLDAVFPILHGKNGEDGTVQGLLEMAKIPVIGCKTLSSALCMHKDMAHRLVGAAGIRVPRSHILERAEAEEFFTRPETAADTLMRQLNQKGLVLPLFVKPVCAGSSFGITKVTPKEELAPAICTAFDHDRQVILEETIEGFEVGCAIMGNETLTVGNVDEIQLSGGFFNYEEKYTLKTSQIFVPARISDEKARQIKETAQKIYRILDCRDFARIDMFLMPSGEICFNEVNTIPGFTPHSRFPGMMKSAGFSFEQVIDTLIGLEVSL